VVKTFGSSTDPDELAQLWTQAQQFAHSTDEAQGKLFAVRSAADQAVEQAMTGLRNTSLRTIGPELIFGTVFDRLGFGSIRDTLFRHLVLARLTYPVSKLKTVDYLERYQGRRISVSAVYKFLDRLQSRYKDTVERLSYRQTLARLGGSVTVVFYDMTTLYFETDDEDDLKKIGFSKDGKFQCPQIMLGLLVGLGGLPIGYDLFQGNTFEGHTLIPTLKQLQAKYDFPKPIVVADAGLLSKSNLKELAKSDYQFILGARVKNETDALRAEILERTQGLSDGGSVVLTRPDHTRLVVTYAENRATKDAHNRQRGLEKLRAKVKTGTLSKQHVTNRGYAKFLALTGEMTVAIDETKVTEDERWDGLKGYVTNTLLDPPEVVANYRQLWHIERAFRISKTDLRIRPIYHSVRRRIEAHICIAFVAYAIWKEVEQLLVIAKVTMTAKRAAELTQTMYELNYQLPDSQEQRHQILRLSHEQQTLYDAIHPK
jgi:transposase